MTNGQFFKSLKFQLNKITNSKKFLIAGLLILVITITGCLAIKNQSNNTNLNSSAATSLTKSEPKDIYSSPVAIPDKYYSNKTIYQSDCRYDDQVLINSRNPLNGNLILPNAYNINRFVVVDNQTDIHGREACEDQRADHNQSTDDAYDLREGDRFIITYSCRNTLFDKDYFNFYLNTIPVFVNPTEIASCGGGENLIEPQIFDLASNRYFHLSNCMAYQDGQTLTRLSLDNNPGKVDLCYGDPSRYEVEQPITYDLKDSMGQESKLKELNDVRSQYFNLSTKYIDLGYCDFYKPSQDVADRVHRMVIDSRENKNAYIIRTGEYFGMNCETGRYNSIREINRESMQINLGLNRFISFKVCNAGLPAYKLDIQQGSDPAKLEGQNCKDGEQTFEKAVYDLQKVRYLHFSNCQSNTEIGKSGYDILPRLSLDNNPNPINLCSGDGYRSLIENYTPTWDLKI